MIDLALWGGPGMFLAAFVGATLVPVSSEAAFAALLVTGYPVVPALAWATLGNTVGCTLNYALGQWGRDRVEARLRTSRAGRTAVRWTELAGVPTLLLSWLPIVGDPLTLAAGVARVRLAVFFVLVVSVRFGRYAVLAWALAR